MRGSRNGAAVWDKAVKARFGPYIVRTGRSLVRSEWLISAAYWKQGYIPNHMLTGNDVVIDAELYGSVVGTVLVKLDGVLGLLADESYPAELDSLRSQGRRLAELSRFAILPGQPTRSVMGAMFHCVYYHTRLLNGTTDLVCEVVPRHVAAQQRLLSFQQIAGPKPCTRVGVSEAVLLHRVLS
jgi:hypothetical protein